MAGKLFFSVTMSLDGFVAPEKRMGDPEVRRRTAQRMELQQWIFPHRFLRENLKLGEGGEGGRDRLSTVSMRLLAFRRMKTATQPAPGAARRHA